MRPQVSGVADHPPTFSALRALSPRPSSPRVAFATFGTSLKKGEMLRATRKDFAAHEATGLLPMIPSACILAQGQHTSTHGRNLSVHQRLLVFLHALYIFATPSRHACQICHRESETTGCTRPLARRTAGTTSGYHTIKQPGASPVLTPFSPGRSATWTWEGLSPYASGRVQ